MTRPVTACIDTNALSHNLSRVRQLAPGSRIMAIVKADAYGHGLLHCCQALNTADAFGLLDLDDAIALRKAGFRQRICLLEGFFTADELADIAQHEIEPVIHSSWQLDLLEAASPDLNFSVWVKVDTGMNRLGFTRHEYSRAMQRLTAMKCIDRASILSHLANADLPENPGTRNQLEQFRAATTADHNNEKSLANSAAILAHSDCHMDWVRPGIMLYGSSPFSDKTARDLDLRPTMSLRSEIIAIRNLQKGDAVGYGSTWVCPEAMAIGVVACGYGDGYPRHAPSGTPVSIAGRRSIIVGRVSMDMITVDLRNIEDAKVGTPVELWGRDVPVDQVAALSGTISYELLCGVTARVKREVMPDG